MMHDTKFFQGVGDSPAPGNKPTINDLIYLLRHRSTWPEGFQWNYNTSATCAMGLAHRKWPEYVRNVSTASMIDAFEMNDRTMTRIFCHARSEHPVRTFFRVSPELIAQDLEQEVGMAST